MGRVLRGEIYWADLDPTVGHEQAGRRPVLVLSHDVFNERSGTVIVAAVTSREPRAAFPLSVALVGTGLPKPSWVRCNQVRTLSVERLRGRAGRARPEDLERAVEGLNEIVGT